MTRYYYADSIENFLSTTPEEILGIMAHNNQFDLTDTQRNAWFGEIALLKEQLFFCTGGHIIFEYTIPRIGGRIDVVLLYKGIVFLLEFKYGENGYPSNAIDQVTDYALDLLYFHEESSNLYLAPILICTDAPSIPFSEGFLKESIFNVQCSNATNIGAIINIISTSYIVPEINAQKWIQSRYAPTPTIVEAAQNMYQNHNIADISRNDASALNLNKTTTAVNNIVEYSKKHMQKSICFITGVPGAGKTLAGLNIAIERQKIDENEHAVFLSGNAPLVAVLQEALARDDSARNNIKKSEAKRKSKEFIQIIHHFRDDAISTTAPPIEKVAVFDEAQRAWTEQQLINFMERKKGISNFDMSEPEFLINIMNRHNDWAVIVCLIGGGQEINTGEAGIQEWFRAIQEHYPDWNVFVSDKITDTEYIGNTPLPHLLKNITYKFIPELHLSVSLRSFRSENVSAFVKSIIDCNLSDAQMLYQKILPTYPIYITRDLPTAKNWIREQAKGTERYGLIASSKAYRLRANGVWVQNKIEAENWFLNEKTDVRSSYFLEEVATEFDIQGLEIDWSIVCWDGDFRFSEDNFDYYKFTGAKWNHIHSLQQQQYLKNAYRVLLTRARQGFVIFVPTGNKNDVTRNPSYYDGTYHYLKNIGIQEL